MDPKSKVKKLLHALDVPLEIKCTAQNSNQPITSLHQILLFVTERKTDLELLFRLNAAKCG